MIIIPKYVSKVINRLEISGYSAYIVGGSVRDSLLGREVHDFDVASSALPQEILEIFKDFKTVNNGMKHGTIGVISDGKMVEITTFRSDGQYTDFRRPDSVSFVKRIEDDLSRRDFTINAIAYNEKEGIIDPYGGCNDLKLGIIRCVGDPIIRFSEDALRILRGIRFSSTLNFSIEFETMQAMLKTKSLLKKIAKERISNEIEGILLGDNIFNVLLSCKEIIYKIIPELKIQNTYVMKKYPDITLWDHTIKAVSMTEKIFSERFCMLLHDVAKPQCKVILDGTEKYPDHAMVGAKIAERILERFRFDNKTNSIILKLIESHSVRFPTTLADMRRFVRNYGIGFTKIWLDIKYADVFSKHHKESTAQLYYAAMEFYNKIVRENLCCTLAQLDISGNDLLENGIIGKNIGITLDKLLELVISEKCANKREDLLNACINIDV